MEVTSPLTYVDDLIALIKQKKELASLDNELVLRHLSPFLHPVDVKKYPTFEKFARSNSCKQLVQQTRKKLREIYGMFITRPLSSLSPSSFSSSFLNQLLESHQSTAERKDAYPFLYKELFLMIILSE